MARSAAPLARIDRPVRSHFYRGARAQAGIYGTRCTVYGVRYTLYVLYRLWAGWSRESLDKARARTAPLALGSAFARSLCTENGIHGRCVRATARRVPFFILRPSPRLLPIRPLTPRFRVPAGEKEKLLSRQTREDNVAIVPT